MTGKFFGAALILVASTGLALAKDAPPPGGGRIAVCRDDM